MPSPKTLICLTGTRAAGKDTFFSILNRSLPNKFARFAFADALKDSVDNLSFEMFDKPASRLIGSDKETFRPILIAVGCTWCEIDPLHWVKIVNNDIKYSGMAWFNDIKTPVITDCRFANEVKFFKNLEGTTYDKVICVKIECKDGPEPTDEEKRNQPEVDKLVDYTINWETALTYEAHLNSLDENHLHTVLHKHVDDFISKFNLNQS